MFDIIIGYHKNQEESFIKKIINDFNNHPMNATDFIQYMSCDFKPFINTCVGPCTDKVIILYGCRPHKINMIFSFFSSALTKKHKIDSQYNSLKPFLYDKIYTCRLFIHESNIKRNNYEAEKELVLNWAKSIADNYSTFN